MAQENIYERFAHHLSKLALGLPYRKELVDIVKEVFSPLEVEVALALPTEVIPLQPVKVDDIIGKLNLPRKELVEILENLTRRGLLFSGKTKDGEKGYALLQMSFGFTQTYFWKGEVTPLAKRMTELIIRYYAAEGVMKGGYRGKSTQAFRYIPPKEAVEHMIGIHPHDHTAEVTFHKHEGVDVVFPYEMMEGVVAHTRTVAQAHCPCRMRTQILGTGCNHLLDVCLKFDELAEDLINKGQAREITKVEALELIKKSEEDGLVHMVDNAQGEIKHNCNCCGCCCVILNNVKTRKVSRDLIIATYFIQEPDKDKCIGCGECANICPVDAITIEGDFALVDKDWCVGCGLCITRCNTGAAKLVKKPGLTPPQNVMELHEEILRERRHFDP